MSQTLVITFTDTEIRRQAGNAGVRDMRDARYPGVYFRFHQNRDRGTWHLVVGKKWEKIAGFPELPVKGLINALPKIRERLAADPKASAAAGTLQTVGQLLDWFMVRQSTEKSLSSKRRATNTSIITCHLKPRLCDLLVDEVDRSALDKMVMWPMQAEMSLSYVRLMAPAQWDVLVAKYSTHKGNKVASIGRLISRIQSPAPQLFIYKAVTAWAIPKLKGVQVAPRGGCEVVCRGLRDDLEHAAVGKMIASGWKTEVKVERGQYVKRSTDMIVLPAEFYDMNTWDIEGKPESTRRRWKTGIARCLEKIEEQAVVHATEIFDREEIFIDAA